MTEIESRPQLKTLLIIPSHGVKKVYNPYFDGGTNTDPSSQQYAWTLTNTAIERILATKTLYETLSERG